jgi:hypothetical protein
VLEVIERECGWRPCESDPSAWRFDCRLNALKNYLFRETVGFTEKDEMLSNLVREQQLSREQALERLERENDIPAQAIAELLGDIGLSMSSLRTALQTAA